METLGVAVLRSVPSQRGFNQPCPLWRGQCTVYETEHYPRFCRTYKCKLLKKLLDESISLPHALKVIEKARTQIDQMESLLPASKHPNFRERLVAELAATDDPGFRQKAENIIRMYEEVFGVDEVLE
jgi:hypothetical protein